MLELWSANVFCKKWIAPILGSVGHTVPYVATTLPYLRSMRADRQHVTERARLCVSNTYVQNQVTGLDLAPGLSFADPCTRRCHQSGQMEDGNLFRFSDRKKTKLCSGLLSDLGTDIAHSGLRVFSPAAPFVWTPFLSPFPGSLLTPCLGPSLKVPPSGKLFHFMRSHRSPWCPHPPPPAPSTIICQLIMWLIV